MLSLETALLDLHRGIAGSDISLIIGGGFGVYLKARHVALHASRTLLHEYPEVRATNDIDLFLRPELLIQPQKLRPLVDELARQGYRSVGGSEYYQFEKPGPGGSMAGSVKIDILTGPQSRFEGTSVVTDERRVRPTPSIGLHAHPVNDAPTLEEKLFPMDLDGRLSDGTPWRAGIYLPHPFTYLMMKLAAFADRMNEADKEFGRYHAMDIYTVMAYMTESEWNESLELRDRFSSAPHVLRICRLVSEHFSRSSAIGIIRLKEGAYYRPRLQVEEFRSALQEVFPLSGRH